MVDINISWKTFSYQGLNISQRTLSQFLSFDVYRLCVRLLHVSDNVWICFTGLTEMCKKEYVISDAWPGISCNEGIYIYISWQLHIVFDLDFNQFKLYLSKYFLQLAIPSVSFDDFGLLKQQCQLMSAARKKIKVFLMSYNVPIKVIVTL